MPAPTTAAELTEFIASKTAEAEAKRGQVQQLTESIKLIAFDAESGVKSAKKKLTDQTAERTNLREQIEILESAISQAEIKLEKRIAKESKSKIKDAINAIPSALEADKAKLTELVTCFNRMFKLYSELHANGECSKLYNSVRLDLKKANEEGVISVGNLNPNFGYGNPLAIFFDQGRIRIEQALHNHESFLTMPKREQFLSRLAQKLILGYVTPLSSADTSIAQSDKKPKIFDEVAARAEVLEGLK